MPLKSFTSPLVTVGLAATGPSYILIGDAQGRARGDGTAVRRSCSTFAARRRACSPSLRSRPQRTTTLEFSRLDLITSVQRRR